MNILRIITLCTGICLLAGCTQEQEQPSPASAPLHVASVLFSETMVDSNTATRAAVPLPIGSSIGVFCSQPAGYTTAQKNVRYTYDATAGVWVPDAADKGVYLLPQQLQVCAYYPYNAAYADQTAIPLEFGEYTGTSDNLIAYDEKDVCYAVNRTMSSSNTSTTFALKHAMALLVLTLTRPDDASTVCRITKLELANSALMQNAVQDIATGAAPTGSTVPSLTWTPSTPLVVPADGSSVSVKLRLIPANLNFGGLKLTFTIEGKPVSATIAQSTLLAIEAGKLYDVSLEIGAAGFTPGVVVTDWVQVGTADDPAYSTRPVN